MDNSEETLKQNDAVLQAIAELSNKIDERINNLEKNVNERFNAVDIQFESIREGIVHNSVAFDRLQATVFSLRADMKELTEEVRHLKKGNLVTLEK